jgi:hypothetical protein
MVFVRVPRYDFIALKGQVRFFLFCQRASESWETDKYFIGIIMLGYEFEEDIIKKGTIRVSFTTIFWTVFSAMAIQVWEWTLFDFIFWISALNL